MTLNILSFGFTIAAVLLANYIMLLGIRDILYFILPEGGPRKPFNLSAGKARPFEIMKRILFWFTFVSMCLLFPLLIFPFLLFVTVGRVFFSSSRVFRISPGPMAMLTSILLILITYVHVRSQPVIQKFGSQFSADMWIYNTCNSLLESMMLVSMKYSLPTSGIEYLAGLIPQIQANLYGFMVLSIYIFCCVLMDKLGRIFLPNSGYKAPLYFMLPPVKIFAPVAVGMVVCAKYMDMPILAFTAAGVYYIWGVNLLVYLLRGGHWLINLVLLAACAMHPVSIAVFVVFGIVDNLLDLRRIAGLLGVDRQLTQQV